MSFNGLVSGAGDFFGSGTSTFNGGYSPGDSPAVVEIDSDVTFGNANTLSIELGGLFPGDFDSLQIVGDVTLDGLLDVSMIAPNTLSSGQSYEIIDVEGSLTGEFIGLSEGDMIGNFNGIDLLISYMGGDGNDVVLFTNTINLMGDYNDDGYVDAADYAVWRDNVGQPAGSLPNDPSGTAIGTIQYENWIANYGVNSVASTISTPVPEPTTLLLTLAALASVIKPSGRKRNENIAD